MSMRSTDSQSRPDSEPWGKLADRGQDVRYACLCLLDVVTGGVPSDLEVASENGDTFRLHKTMLQLRSKVLSEMILALDPKESLSLPESTTGLCLLMCSLLRYPASLHEPTAERGLAYTRPTGI
eukprot:g1878.t1